MFKTMYELLATHAPLTALVPVERIYETGSLEDNPERPFLVLAWQPSVQSSVGARSARILEVHAHDNRGSQALLRAIMRVIKDRLEGVAQYQGTDGWVTQCDFVGDGGELMDPETSTNLQFTRWQVVGRTT